MSDTLANSLSAASTGLQTKEDYKRKREDLLQAAALGTRAPVASEPTESDGADALARKKKKKKAGSASVLSFGDELDEGDTSPRLHAKGIGKERNREAVLAAESQQASKQEYLLALQKAKTEPITLAYSFRSEVTQRELPKGVHQGTITTTKGATSVRALPIIRAFPRRKGRHPLCQPLRHAPFTGPSASSCTLCRHSAPTILSLPRPRAAPP
jgi:hypothetical protein